MDSGDYRRAIGSIFGDQSRESKKSYYDPLVQALELEINMISYDVEFLCFTVHIDCVLTVLCGD